MAGDLQAGFTNNINIIAIREAGNNGKTYTDRAIDIDGDGNVETVTVTTDDNSRGGNKVRHTYTKPDGVARTPVKRPTETDLGINTDGSEFTQGVE